MLIKKEYTGKYLLFSILSILAASGNMGVIYLINRVIDNYFSGTQLLYYRYMMLFGGALILFFVCRSLAARSIINFTQKLLRKTRMEMIRMVLRSSYAPVIREKARIFSALTRDTDNVVNASVNIVDIFTNSIVIIICFVFMGQLSIKLLGCMLVLLCFTLAIYFYSERMARKLFIAAMARYDVFVKYVNEILSGFKEIVVERKKGMSIVEKHIETAINDVSALNQQAQIKFLTNRIIGQMGFYVFIGSLLLFLGAYMGIEKSVVINFIFLILYIWGPIETVVLLIPNLSQARISLQRITDLEKKISEFESDKEQRRVYTGFNNLLFNNIMYQYRTEDDPADQLFCIGPVDFNIRQGEIIFISGGNGSGKTTFINILIGLFAAHEGEIILDGDKVEISQLQDYRSLFATVFNDFHLFDELYGIELIDPLLMEEYLQVMELDHKITFNGEKFSSTNMSAGQRKRLALIAAVMEKKPILVLDEFGADQDPRFKRRFYNEILELLRSKGFTIIMITHDEQYYHCADKLFRMENGQLSPVVYKKDSQILSVGLS
ncbi:cyclic peptide export ABC transporter [Chitinophaga oryziterrae]|uniref:Cyclic peptide export ABC transporter n=1 Tax=Chitinophaga oryziterrae TaxID=1031224 RepID=A0A6N8JD21_9BACT|nr:cyclic peptide export ABC transporter [Chitinophaga oryziterrae]MVT42256.1 cyclic peptide export ABC transporter [Chitinophaga oryziterrae]